MAIEITCRRPGFRRAGIAHPAIATYPAELFSDEQLLALMSEPLLALRRVPDENEQGVGQADVPGPDAPHNVELPVEFAVVSRVVPAPTPAPEPSAPAPAPEPPTPAPAPEPSAPAPAPEPKVEPAPAKPRKGKKA